MIKSEEGVDLGALGELRERFASLSERFPFLHHLLIRGGEYQAHWANATHLVSRDSLPPAGRERIDAWALNGAMDDVAVFSSDLWPAWSWWRDGERGWCGYFCGPQADSSAYAAFQKLAMLGHRALTAGSKANDGDEAERWEWRSWIIHLHEAAWKRAIPVRGDAEIRLPHGGLSMQLKVTDLPAWRARSDDHPAAIAARLIPDPPTVWSSLLDADLFLTSALFIDAKIREACANSPAVVFDHALLGVTGLAEHFGVSAEALRKRLERWRPTNQDGWIEVSDRRAREPQFLYRIGRVREVISDLQAPARLSGRRPPKK